MTVFDENVLTKSALFDNFENYSLFDEKVTILHFSVAKRRSNCTKINDKTVPKLHSVHGPVTHFL